LVSLETIGQSYEGRDLVVIKICRGGCDGKKIMWVDSGDMKNYSDYNKTCSLAIHAREWIGPAVSLYIVDKLVRGELPDGDFDPAVIDDLAWYILPVWNTDGYAFSWTDNRQWRKTR